MVALHSSSLLLDLFCPYYIIFLHQLISNSSHFTHSMVSYLVYFCITKGSSSKSIQISWQLTVCELCQYWAFFAFLTFIPTNRTLSYNNPTKIYGNILFEAFECIIKGIYNAQSNTLYLFMNNCDKISNALLYLQIPFLHLKLVVCHVLYCIILSKSVTMHR